MHPFLPCIIHFANKSQSELLSGHLILSLKNLPMASHWTQNRILTLYHDLVPLCSTSLPLCLFPSHLPGFSYAGLLLSLEHAMIAHLWPLCTPLPLLGVMADFRLFTSHVLDVFPSHCFLFSFLVLFLYSTIQHLSHLKGSHLLIGLPVYNLSLPSQNVRSMKVGSHLFYSLLGPMDVLRHPHRGCSINIYRVNTYLSNRTISALSSESLQSICWCPGSQAASQVRAIAHGAPGDIVCRDKLHFRNPELITIPKQTNAFMQIN